MKGVHKSQVGAANRKRVLDALNPVLYKTRDDVAQELGVGHTSASTHLNLLRSEGTAEYLAGSGYRLPGQPPRPFVLDLLIKGFTEAEPLVNVWSRVPDVAEGEDDEACDHLATYFTRWCTARAVRAVSITAHNDTPFSEYHCWTEVSIDDRVWHVDFTARQFHNLCDPPLRWHSHLPTPLVWTSEAHYHPVLGPSLLVVEGVVLPIE